MIQGNFSAAEGPKTEGFSGGQFCFGVEALHNTAGKLPFGAEPVEQQRPVIAQHSRDPFHWLDLRAHGLGAPDIQKATGPVRRYVAPEELELLLEQVGADRFEVVLQQLGQPDLLFLGEVFRALEQQPATLAQNRLIAVLLERFGFAGAHLVERLAEVRHDVEAIQYMDGLAGLFGDDFQVGLPHVAAHVFQPRAALRTQPAEEAQQGLDLPIPADPQQTLAVGIDLVDQRQVTMAPSARDLVDPDQLDARQILWARSHSTAISTDRNTLSQEARKTVATSFHDSRRAHCARNQA